MQNNHKKDMLIFHPHNHKSQLQLLPQQQQQQAYHKDNQVVALCQVSQSANSVKEESKMEENKYNSFS